jgi:serine/threonine protein kinase
MDLFSHTLYEEIEKVKSDGTNMNIKESASATETSTSSSPDEADIEVSGVEQPPIPASSSNDGSGGAIVSQTIQPRIQEKGIYTTYPLSSLPSTTTHIIETVKYLITMIEIIGRIHEAGIVHRDIKPENFMVSGGVGVGVDKRLYIIDFGLSRFYMKGDKHVANTCDKSIVGTMRYISTHIHDGDVYSRRDDIISIIYVAIYLAKGKLPWMGMSPPKGDIRTKEDMVYDKKLKTTSDELCEGIPYVFKKILDYSYRLEFDEKPDYSYMTRQCKNYLKLYL